MSHREAEALCSSEGARLAVPRSEKSNNVIHQLVKAQLEIHSIGNLLVRIGIDDRKHEGDWLSSDGSKLTYSNWADGEPNDQGNEDCGTIARDTGLWHDFSCDTNEPFICQKTTSNCGNCGCDEGPVFAYFFMNH